VGQRQLRIADVARLPTTQIVDHLDIEGHTDIGCGPEPEQLQ
jgi:hypothetical protein